MSSFEVHAQQSPLLGLLQELHCAQSEQQAASLLEQLSKLPLQPFGIPSETLTNKQNSELYAATVDIMLRVLYDTIQRFPMLQEKVERTALLWNYCDIINDGDLTDLIVSNKGEVNKKEAIGPFPVHKQGFSIWGFTRSKSEKHYVPELLNYPSLFPRAYQELLQRLTQKQCFPNPDVINNTDKHAYYGLLRLSEALEPGTKYPYVWKEECLPKAVFKKTSAQVRVPVIKQSVPKEVKPIVREKAPAVRSVAESTSKPVEEPVKTKPKPKTNKAFNKAENKPERTFISGLIADKYMQPTEQETPVISTAIPSGGSNIGAPLPLPPSNGLGLAGNFYHRAKLTGAMSIGANVGWKPYSYFFVRGGVNYNYLSGTGDFSYSWGVGYDDWHPGTFSAQINNWGPIVPGKKSFFDGASANFGYKFVADFLRPYHLTGSAAVNIPFSGDPSISTTWVWSPIEHWFVRASLSKSLTKAGGLDWSYSFGYSDWHPFTFSLTYDNWGTNPIFDSSQSNSFNFTENGAISLSWNWAF